MPDNISNIKINTDINKTGEHNFPILARIAIYDNMRSIPQTIDLRSDTVGDFINNTSQQIYNLSHKAGGVIPFTIIREVVENLIHADFSEVTVNITDNGNNIIISDQGPGIENKDKAFLPGYTSATTSMKKYIRGVGSGLPIVKETIVFSGGSVDISDNIRKGTVVSLKIEAPQGKNTDLVNKDNSTPTTISNSQAANIPAEDFENLKLSLRQNKILFLVLELEETGPSKIAKELGFSLSTSYRELIFLENKKLLTLTNTGKRKLSPKCKKYLEYYSNNF
ncbi:MAG: histidine kinase [Actinobacteria bacterium]|nr:histidine kinase [Actinomycetota bacterium]